MKAAYFVNLMQDFFGKLSAGNKKQESVKRNSLR
jgi:hypothetical protein